MKNNQLVAVRYEDKKFFGTFPEYRKAQFKLWELGQNILFTGFENGQEVLYTYDSDKKAPVNILSNTELIIRY